MGVNFLEKYHNFTNFIKDRKLSFHYKCSTFKKQLKRYPWKNVWWVGGWVNGWEGIIFVLTITYSNKKISLRFDPSLNVNISASFYQLHPPKK